MLGGGARPRAASAVTYERTAFFDKDTGDNETAIVNDPAHPWGTLNGAIEWAASNLAGSGVTVLRLLTDSVDGIDLDATVDTVLLAGLTIMSHSPSSVRSILGQAAFGSATIGSVSLSLLDINIAILERELSTDKGTINPTAGTITGSGTVVIGQLNLRGIAGSNGGNGSNGGTTTGATGTKGSNGDPPVTGDNGESVNCSGGNGVGHDGVTQDIDGASGYNLTLSGVGTVVASDTRGGNGAAAGDGGNGGTATGGNGGEGGDSTASEMQDGGFGGNGGDAVANGGEGGVGGFGGRGGVITKAAEWTIMASSVNGGTGGEGGSGGGAGTANAGAGGLGGYPAFGGATGPSGSPGSTSATAGNNGANGTNGADGAIA